MFRRTIPAGLALVAFNALSLAQESPTPEQASVPPPARSVRISFVPPPLDGTISLGVYDAKGKLVRVLLREADINEFTIGQDALSKTWDGKNDAGENVPPGKYSAHGFVVGDLKIEGVGFFFNDWVVSADAPRFSRIRSLTMRDENLLLEVELVPSASGHVHYDVAHKTTELMENEVPADPSSSPSLNGAGAVDPIMAISGRNGTRWVIARAENGANTTELKQFSASGEFLRRLPVSATDPQPKAIAASMTEDRIYLLEENEAGQRVRGLSLAATKSDGAEQPVSEWKVELEKWIYAHKDFSLQDGKPVAAGAKAQGPEKVKIKLRSNPLLKDERVTVELAVGSDAD